ncbi:MULTISPECIES: efflux RND transporter periplasmic adaptor subunit [Sphingobacterium]|uniref:Efflux RND transporter periplasmic adaptor subunit n=1 Tax=Sphingobacterium hotanense TaxID=649196 RepID=A0ABT7NNQ0_9SPHI|nr:MULTISPECIES: efflux RND transporter periplasmic adaptor subunit [Sphingobacterium]MDM1048736.1 efflux RND transporter periplasmic adaptor subunit [Sphingobacterium hotanense]
MQKSIRSISSSGDKSSYGFSKKRFRFIGSAGFIISALLMTGCGQGYQEQGGWGQDAPELPVDVITQQTTSVQKEYAASIEGITNVEIRPQVSGYLTKIYVDEGVYVKAGQPLFKIEDRVYQEQLRNAQASLTSAEANLMTAKINLDRKKELVSSKVVTELQVQEAQALYNAAQGAVDQAKSAVESARININFSTIKAPVSGYIGRLNYRLGSLLSPTNVSAITVLSDISQVYAYFSMSENDFVDFQTRYSGNSLDEKLRSAPDVDLLISNGSKYELQGKIDAIDGQFNQTTGSITLRAKFNNPKMILRSGNTGKIVLAQIYENAVLLPVASTMTIQDKIFAFTVDNESKAVQVPIQIEGKAETNFIVTEGVKPGDKYIVTGFERLQTGTPIVEAKQNQE